MQDSPRTRSAIFDSSPATINTEEHPQITLLPPFPEPRTRPRPHEGLTRRPWVRAMFAAGFRAAQRAGINLTPNHFYWPIPDFRQLDHRDWEALSQMVGVDLHLDAQLRMVHEFVDRYRDEMHFPEAPSSDPTEFHFNNGFFETVDAEIAYCMVRHHKPRRMIEVGGGNTTRLSATAMRRNADEGYPGKFFTIEPHADKVLCDGIPGLTRLIRRPVQQIAVAS